jgi:hypothetical protein
MIRTASSIKEPLDIDLERPNESWVLSSNHLETALFSSAFPFLNIFFQSGEVSMRLPFAHTNGR